MKKDKSELTILQGENIDWNWPNWSWVLLRPGLWEDLSSWIFVLNNEVKNIEEPKD